MAHGQRGDGGYRDQCFRRSGIEARDRRTDGDVVGFDPHPAFHGALRFDVDADIEKFVGFLQLRQRRHGQGIGEALDGDQAETLALAGGHFPGDARQLVERGQHPVDFAAEPLSQWRRDQLHLIAGEQIDAEFMFQGGDAAA